MPISSLTLEQLDGRAAEIAPQARRIWFGAAFTPNGHVFEALGK